MSCLLSIKPAFVIKNFLNSILFRLRISRKKLFSIKRNPSFGKKFFITCTMEIFRLEGNYSLFIIIEIEVHKSSEKQKRTCCSVLWTRKYAIGCSLFIEFSTCVTLAMSSLIICLKKGPDLQDIRPLNSAEFSRGTEGKWDRKKIRVNRKRERIWMTWHGTRVRNPLYRLFQFSSRKERPWGLRSLSLSLCLWLFRIAFSSCLLLPWEFINRSLLSLALSPFLIYPPSTFIVCKRYSPATSIINRIYFFLKKKKKFSILRH